MLRARPQPPGPSWKNVRSRRIHRAYRLTGRAMALCAPWNPTPAQAPEIIHVFEACYGVLREGALGASTLFQGVEVVACRPQRSPAHGQAIHAGTASPMRQV